MNHLKHLLFVSTLCSLVLCTNCGEDENAVNAARFTGSIGDPYQGGKVLYLFQEGDAGYVAGEVHGLIAAPDDEIVGAPYSCSNVSGATGTAIGTGAQNTLDILASCSDDYMAARISADLEIGGYDDWYLPSKDEAWLLYLNCDKIYPWPGTIFGDVDCGCATSSQDSDGFWSQRRVYDQIGQPYVQEVVRPNTINKSLSDFVVTVASIRSF
mgnify:FL=1